MIVSTDIFLNSIDFSSILGSHCINPPDPDAQYKLKKIWNPLAPPAHNDTVLYICDAGTNYNRLESDFNKWNYTLKCLENNVFEGEAAGVAWPTCADGDYLKMLKFF